MKSKKIIFKFSDPPKITKTTGAKFGYITIGKGEGSARKFFNTEEDWFDFLEKFQEKQMQRSRESLNLFGKLM